jgi:isoleucyl-tRNA synthetase
VDETQRQNIEAVKSLILNEVNVKELNFADSTTAMLVKRVKPNFKKLGPRYGKIMKQLVPLLQEISQNDINTLEKDGVLTFNINGQQIEIHRDDVEIISEDIPGWLVGTSDKITVGLDISITDELRKEGIARELVNRIQNLRKAKDFEITDRISLEISANPMVDEAIRENAEYIKSQVLANNIQLTSKNLEDKIEIDDQTLTITIKKIN